MKEHDAEDALAPSAADHREQSVASPFELERLKSEFRQRLLTASLRTEAVRAGMIDLDGLKLLDVSALQLDENDTVVNGQDVMQSLRQRKPWLFRTMTSSSPSVAPSTRPVRQKSAMEMSDEEYRAARSALIKR